MKPIRDKVLVKEIPVDKIGSLFIPTVGKAGQRAPTRGTVIAVGGEVTEVKAGDVIVFERFAPMQVIEDMLLMPESSIAAIEEE